MAILRRLAPIALIILGAGAASALTIVDPCTVAGPGPTELGTATSGAVSCPDFSLNPTWLNSVTITISGSINSTLTLTSFSGSSQTGSANTDSEFNLASPLAGFSFTPDGFGNL